jgi:hypothetical protein
MTDLESEYAPSPPREVITVVIAGIERRVIKDSCVIIEDEEGV